MKDEFEARQDASSISRRQFVSRAGVGAVWLAAAAACAREADKQTSQAPQPVQPMASPAAPPTPPKLMHFTADEAAEVEAMAARIIPSDDGPGAREAGVVFFIDNTMTTFAKEQAPLFAAGLKTLAKEAALDGGASAKFSSLTPAQQDKVLKRIEKTPFFGAMRFATIAGFLSLPKYGGNKDYVGWKYVGQANVMEQKPPFGWYDRPENQQALLGRVL